MRNFQLFSCLPQGFRLPTYVDFDGKVGSKDGANIPFMYWPDGVPCFGANAYMLALSERGLSRRNRGGTLREYALNISHLIRFCYNNQCDLHELTDNTFTLFIKTFQAGRNAKNGLIRQSNHVIKVGRTCIDFLFFIEKIFDQGNKLIGENGSIKVQLKAFNVQPEGSSKKIFKQYWHHHSFPTPSSFKKRHPISDDAVEKLKIAARSTKDRGLRKRRECMLSALEQTGGRRAEVACITIRDVEIALGSNDTAPMLRMITVKRGSTSHEREVPVPRIFLVELSDYIRTSRRKIIRNTIGEKNDHGVLFISHTTGKPLSVDTITTEMSDLCLLEKIEEKAHPHLFRHRYITEKLKAIILQHDIENKDLFRKALLNTTAFKLKLKEWTGQSKMSSLDTYIDLAFNELSNMSAVYDGVRLSSAVTSTLDRIESIKIDTADTGVLTAQILSDINSMLSAFKEDILEASRPKS